MRGIVAKKLRREAFGDMPIKYRSYGVQRHKIYKTREGKDGKKEMYFVDRDTVVCTGPRAVYQKLKKERTNGHH